MRITKKGVGTVVVLGAIAAWLTAEERSNPPVEVTLNWPDEEVADLFRRACMDCHSHETDWPWYSRLAPVYWYMNRNVSEARAHFNVSLEEWGDADEAAHELRSGEMPPSEYLLLHPDARLDKNQKELLADGMTGMFGAVDDEERREREALEEEWEQEQATQEQGQQGGADDAGGSDQGGDDGEGPDPR